MNIVLLSVTVFIYLAITAYLGYRGYLETKNAADYLLAGRKIHPVIMALSYGSTFISTSAIVGFGGAAGVFGMGLLWLTFLNIFVGIFIAFAIFGKRSRKMGHNLDAHTFSEFMGRRFGSRFIQGAAGLVIFVGMPLYAAAVVIGGTQFLSQTLRINYDVTLFFFTAIVALYVLAGGMKSVMYTDAFQGGLMFIGMALLLVFSYVSLGGPLAAHQTLTEMAPAAVKTFGAQGHQGWTAMPAFGSPLWLQLVTTIVMGVGIGVLAQPQLVVRFMTVKSTREINRAVGIGGIFILMMTGVAFTAGALSNAYFAKTEVIVGQVVDEAVRMMPDPARGGKLSILPPGELPAGTDTTKVKTFVAYRLPGEDAATALHYVLRTPNLKIERGTGGFDDRIAPGLISIARTINNETTEKGDVDRIIPTFINSSMPGWFTALFTVTLLAAAMSTLSSQFHSLGAALGRDVLEGGFGVKRGGSIAITRGAMIVGILVSYFLALGLPKAMESGSAIIAIGTSIFFGLCASAFLPMYFGALYSKRITKAGAIAGMLGGVGVTAFWLLFVYSKTSKPLMLCKALTGADMIVDAKSVVQFVDPLIVGLPVSILLTVLVTMMTKPPAEDVLAKSFSGIGRK